MMGIYSRLQRSGLHADVNWTNVDSRWYGPISSGASTFAGFPMGPDLAKRVSAVFACTSLISETLASLPVILYRKTGDGDKERATDHPLYRTLRFRPNVWMTPMDFYGCGQMHAGLRGNAYNEIVINDGEIHLEPLHPDLITVEQLDSKRLRYQYTDPGLGEQRTLTQDQVVHVRDLAEDAVTGQARAVLAREAIAVAAASEAFIGGYFKNDATGRLHYKHPGSLSAEKRKELREMIQENVAGWQNRAKTLITTHGVEVTELGKHDDSGFIVDPRNFQVADIARFWRCPLFMIGLEEKSTTWGTGIEAQKQGFVDFTIKPWTDRWAQALTQALLTEEEQGEFFIEFLFADLVRGDLRTRMQSYKTGREIGVWNPNEIRKKENEGPREGGDEYQNTTPGAAPNASNEPEPEPPEPEVPQALRVDATSRIANAECSAVQRRGQKAQGDLVRWNAWTQQYYRAHRDYVAKVLEPIGEAFSVEMWRINAMVDRIAWTGMAGLKDGVPEGWDERRHTEIAMIIDECLSAGSLNRAA